MNPQTGLDFIVEAYTALPGLNEICEIKFRMGRISPSLGVIQRHTGSRVGFLDLSDGADGNTRQIFIPKYLSI